MNNTIQKNVNIKQCRSVLYVFIFRRFSPEIFSNFAVLRNPKKLFQKVVQMHL